MAKYTAIAEAGNALVKILREGMVPDLIPSSNSIGLCSPADKGDFSLGLYLYDIRESEELRRSGMVDGGASRQQYPPVYLSLYYMLTAYSGSDLNFRAYEEQRILGRALQILYDRNRIPAEELGQSLSGEDLRIELINPPLEDKFKIWNMPDVQFRPSLFYKVSPVEVESTRTRRISRVTEMEFRFKE